MNENVYSSNRSCYSYPISIDVHDVDYNGVARASSLLRYLQSAAQLQLTAHCHSYDELKAANRVFVLSRIRMEFSDTVRAYDPLIATSYPCESRGYSFLRCYRLERDGVTIGRAASVWALLDTERHALVRVDQFDLGIPLLPFTNELTVSHIKLPAELRKIGEYRVRYADADQNRHLNNTRYLDLFCEFLPMEKKRICAATVSYLNEAPLGDLLSVEYGEGIGEEGLPAFFFRTRRGDGRVNAEAEIVLADI